jgi:hypothetical protein
MRCSSLSPVNAELVHLALTLHQYAVGAHAVAEAQPEDVAWHHLRCCDGLPLPICAHTRLQLHLRLQLLHRLPRAQNLHEPQHRVGNKQRADDHRIHVILQPQRDGHHGLQQEGRQAGELEQQQQQRMAQTLHALVATILLLTRSDLS